MIFLKKSKQKKNNQKKKNYKQIQSRKKIGKNKKGNIYDDFQKKWKKKENMKSQKIFKSEIIFETFFQRKKK